MTWKNGCIIASAICFILAALGVIVPMISLPMLAMALFVLSFYNKTP